MPVKDLFSDPYKMLRSVHKSLTKLTDNLFELGLALGSGILMGITLAPVEAWYFAWIALAPLWYLICHKPNSAAIGYGLVWGIGFYGLGLNWIFGIHPMTWMGVPFFASLGIAIFCLTFITLWGASLATFWSISLKLINSKTHQNPVVRVILGTACWCGLEELYSLTDLWWTSLALTQSPHNLPMLHLGQLSGPTTVSAAIVLVNGLIAEACLAVAKHPQQIKLIPKFGNAAPFLGSAIASMIVLHSIGSNLADRPLIEDPVTSLKIGIIQGDIGNEIRHNQLGYQLAIENYTKGYRDLVKQGVDAVVTPETAFPYTESQIRYTSFYQAILDQKVVAFIGGFGEVSGATNNSILAINGEGKVVSRYDKWKLVPLGEYIPFEQYIGKFIDTISPLNSHLFAGKFAPIINTPFGNFIFGICYDSAYPEHFRRQAQTGSLIITASNDAHYGDGMAAQHHAIDLMRAIETDRWTVRASNTGYSAVIDPHGRTKWISKLNEFAAHAHQVYRRNTQTLYVRFGNWLTPLLFAIGLVLFIINSRFLKSRGNS
jgi:apolipoprotein N-acyltransferase